MSVAALFFFTIFAFSVFSPAAFANSDLHGGLRVTAYDDQVAEEMRRQGYKVDGFKKDSKILNAKERDQLMIKSGIYPYVKKWDHFDRDLMTIRCQHQSLAKIYSWYAKIPRENLNKFRALLKADAGEE